VLRAGEVVEPEPSAAAHAGLLDDGLQGPAGISAAVTWSITSVPKPTCSRPITATAWSRWSSSPSIVGRS
jgi:hypothetical protein